ncbi:hypothetical protein V6N13_066747 [Hibiscus sabdariffa]|uniref:Uncharacterized protein n=1 Tax=Hibiscus sabdariffa TaxID=183260 RepID=A0ABR2DRD9_9ROSI
MALVDVAAYCFPTFGIGKFRQNRSGCYVRNLSATTDGPLMRSPILDVNILFRVSSIAVNNRTACVGVLFVNDSKICALFSGPAYGSSRFSVALYAVKVAIDIFKSSG